MDTAQLCRGCGVAADQLIMCPAHRHSISVSAAMLNAMMPVNLNHWPSRVPSARCPVPMPQFDQIFNIWSEIGAKIFESLFVTLFCDPCCVMCIVHIANGAFVQCEVG